MQKASSIRLEISFGGKETNLNGFLSGTRFSMCIRTERMNAVVNGQAQHGSGWGEYQPYIGDALESCINYVSCLHGATDGEIAPERRYFRRES
jgi:hypothetical protein